MKQLRYKSKTEPTGTTDITAAEIQAVQHKKNPDIWVCYAEHMGELAKEEARHHDEDDEDPVRVHQLDSYRNQFYHTYIEKLLKRTQKGSIILEIGAGSGNDAKSLIKDYQLVLTDVSSETLNRTYHRLQKQGEEVKNITFIACDGEHLPFADNQCSAVFMVATFHHFEHPERGLAEVHRVLTPGGRVVLGVEPNKTYFSLIHKCQKLLFKLAHTDTDHISQADAEMEGFSQKEIKTLMQAEKWGNIEIKPMWLFAGFMHYKTEFFYRAFKLKKRIHIPRPLEKAIVHIDEILFKIPGMKHLCWHWIITATKK